MELYLKLFEVLFPVFFIVGIGYFLGRKNPKFDTTFITNYSGNFGAPALFIFAISSSGVTYSVFSEYFIYAVIALTSFALIGVIFLFFLKKDISRELPPYFLPNTGNMGIPICLFAYGTLGMGVAAAISSLVILLHFTINIFLASKKFDIKIILKSPPTYAVIVAVYFLYFDMEMPKVVINTVMLLGYAMIVLILSPIIGFLIIKIFNLTGFAAGVLLIQSAMPSAILTYLVAEMYSPKKVVDSISSMIVVSTLMSLVTVPIIVYISLKYFPY